MSENQELITTKEIETPFAKHKVVIKTILTGAERESIMSSPQRYLKQTNNGKDVEVTNMEAIIHAEKHALLGTSVVSIDGDITNCLERLKKMYEVDYDFVYKSILEEQKKMISSISPAS